MSASAFIELKVPPGVVKTRSGEGAAGRWLDALGVRFASGKPEKRAGFEAINATLLQGLARGMAAWNTTKGLPRYAIGTHVKLYGSVDGIEPTDITPYRHENSFVDALSTTVNKGAVNLTVPATDTGTLANNPFTTTNASPIVTVAHPDHGRETGDLVFFSGATAVATITVAGLYPITKTTDDAYTIEHTSNANAATTGGGAAVVYKWPSLEVGQVYRFYGNSHLGGTTVGGITLEPEYEIVDVLTGDTYALFPNSDKGTLGTDPFATTNTSPTVTVTHVDHGRETGDAVWYEGATVFNNVTIAGDYKITVIDDDSYTITAGTNANAAGSGGGSGVDYWYGASATAADGGGTVFYETYQANPFEVTDGSNIVTMTQSGHGATIRDYFHISGATAVGGITPDGEYLVKEVIDADTFTFEHSAEATSNATGGGADVLFLYEISRGPIDQVLTQRAFGRGSFGRGPLGAPAVELDPVYYNPRTVSIDNIGEDAVLSPLAGAIYYWDSSEGGRATVLPDAPTQLRFICMTEERHLHALGINGDPLVFGWADQEDINEWVPTDTNTANNARRVREGSQLVAMTVVANGVNLIWTDTAVYVHQYTGGSLIYDTRIDARNAGLISPQGFAVTSVGVFWFGPSGFHMWNGVTQPVPQSTDIEDWVKDQINITEAYKCFCAYDAVNNAVDWYFVPNGSAEPSLLVTLSLDDFAWWNGVETRTTGATFNQGAQNPHRVGINGKIYKHEVGLNADGEAIETSLTLAPLELAKGAWVELLGIDPDFKRQTGDVDLAIETYDRNEANTVDTEDTTMSEGEEMADLRSSGRRLSLTFSQTELDGDWAIDTPHIEIKRTGTRR